MPTQTKKRGRLYLDFEKKLIELMSFDETVKERQGFMLAEFFIQKLAMPLCRAIGDGANELSLRPMHFINNDYVNNVLDERLPRLGGRVRADIIAADVRLEKGFYTRQNRELVVEAYRMIARPYWAAIGRIITTCDAVGLFNYRVGNVFAQVRSIMRDVVNNKVKNSIPLAPTREIPLGITLELKRLRPVALQQYRQTVGEVEKLLEGLLADMARFTPAGRVDALVTGAPVGEQPVDTGMPEVLLTEVPVEPKVVGRPHYRVHTIWSRFSRAVKRHTAGWMPNAILMQKREMLAEGAAGPLALVYAPFQNHPRPRAHVVAIREPGDFAALYRLHCDLPARRQEVANRPWTIFLHPKLPQNIVQHWAEEAEHKLPPELKQPQPQPEIVATATATTATAF